MQAGADVIYQATFFDGRWRGHADFLAAGRRARADLGGWSYEVADAKLARRVKAAALLQMCAYSEQVERIQGVAPEQMHVITGDGERAPFRLADYSAYYRRAARPSFEATRARRSAPRDDVSRSGRALRRSAGGPTCATSAAAPTTTSRLVAGMRRDQTRKLTDVGITTAAELAAAPPTSTVRRHRPTPRSSACATRPSCRSQARTPRPAALRAARPWRARDRPTTDA